MLIKCPSQFSVSLCGVVSEWLKEHAWKACNGQKPFKSSNLFNSAIFMLVAFSSEAFASPSQNILQFLINAECEHYPERWSEMGKTDCDFTRPIILTEHSGELKFYNRWKGFISEFKKKNLDLESQQSALILDWYVDNKRREIDLRNDREIIEVFYPSRAVLKHLVAYTKNVGETKPEVLLKKLQNYFSDQRVEAEWHRLVHLRKKYPDGLLPNISAIKDYLTHYEKEMAEIATMLGPQGVDEMKRFRRIVNSYNAYLSGKVLPVAKKDITTDPTWYQQLLEQAGVEELSSEIANRAAEELKGVMSHSIGRPEPLASPQWTNLNEVSELYAQSANSYSDGLRWFINEKTLRGSRDKNLQLARAFLSPRLHLGKIKKKDAEKFLREEIGLTKEKAKDEIRDMLYLNPVQGPAAYAGLLALRSLQEEMRKVWGAGFNEACFVETLKKMSPAPWEAFEESLRQQPACKP